MSKHFRDTLPDDERRLYEVRNAMINRCCNPHDKKYPIYGGRGIEVCDAWRHSWPAFRDWAKRNGHRRGLQIDRRDNNGPYAPWNCRFVTAKENCRNRRDNRWLTFRGVTRCVAAWAESVGMRQGTLSRRLNRYGMSVEEALTRPVRRVRRQTLEKLVETPNRNHATSEPQKPKKHR